MVLYGFIQFLTVLYNFLRFSTFSYISFFHSGVSVKCTRRVLDATSNSELANFVHGYTSVKNYSRSAEKSNSISGVRAAAALKENIVHIVK